MDITDTVVRMQIADGIDVCPRAQRTSSCMCSMYVTSCCSNSCRKVFFRDGATSRWKSETKQKQKHAWMRCEKEKKINRVRGEEKKPNCRKEKRYKLPKLLKYLRSIHSHHVQGSKFVRTVLARKRLPNSLVRLHVCACSRYTLRRYVHVNVFVWPVLCQWKHRLFSASVCTQTALLKREPRKACGVQNHTKFEPIKWSAILLYYYAWV